MCKSTRNDVIKLYYTQFDNKYNLLISNYNTHFNKLYQTDFDFRCLARLYLLHVYKLHILESPPIQPLDRKTVGIKQNNLIDSVITLPSGRTIRKLDNGYLNIFFTQCSLS